MDQGDYEGEGEDLIMEDGIEAFIDGRVDALVEGLGRRRIVLSRKIGGSWCCGRDDSREFA